MAFTPAQVRTLRDIMQDDGKVIRVTGGHPSSWTWHVSGKPRSGTVDRLLCRGYLRPIDRDTLELSTQGRRALGAR